MKPGAQTPSPGDISDLTYLETKKKGYGPIRSDSENYQPVV